MLDTMKMLLEMSSSDTSKDDILNHYLAQAQQIALSYCNTDSLPQTYDATIAEFAAYLYKNRDSLHYKQKAEGERSVTFNVSDGIPDYIKAALPLPKIRVVGGDV